MEEVCSCSADFGLSSSPAWAIVANYTAGAKTLKANQDGDDIEIRDEVSSPGGSVRVYFSPSKVNGNVNCVVPQFNSVLADGYVASSVTGKSKFVSPVDGSKVSTYPDNPTVNNNPTCDTDKFGYFSVQTVVEGTAKYRLLGVLKSYRIEVTFGPDPANPEKTVVLRLRTDSI